MARERAPQVELHAAQQTGAQRVHRDHNGTGTLMGCRVGGRVAQHQRLPVDMPATQGLQRFEALEEPLASLQGLQPTGGAQAITGGHVAALDRFGRLAAGTVQTWAHVFCRGEDRLHGSDVRLVVSGDR